MAITVECQQQLDEHFAQSPYIGSAQIYDKEQTGLGKHRFFYLGYHDLFGVEIPASGRRRGVEFQIWPREWVKRHLKRLDHHIREARAGRYLQVRHNLTLQKRAKQNGREFFSKPKWHKPPETAAKEEGKLPIRGRKKKRTRRELKI